MQQSKKLEEKTGLPAKVLKEVSTSVKNLKTWIDGLIYSQGIEEKLELEDNSVRVMQKYQEIINQAKKSKREIKAMFKNDHDFSEEELGLISDNLIARAEKLLSGYVDSINNEEEVSEDEVLRRLERYKADALMFASVFKTAHEQGELKFEEIKNIDYTSLYSSELNEKQKELIRQVIISNYPKEKQQKDILEKVEQSFQNGSSSEWHLLTKNTNGDEEMVACLRFDDLDEENVYGASFNVGVAYRGSRIGDAMFERAVGEIAQKKRVNAIVEIGKDVSEFYINKGGFNVVGVEQNKKTGIYYYKIERLDQENEYYGSKKQKNEDLLSYFDPDKTIEDLVKLQKYILIKKEDEDKQKNIQGIKYLLKNNYVMTRTVKNKDDKEEETLMVFEKKVDMDIKKAA